MWKPLNKESNTRLLAKITGSQDNAKAESKTAGGIILTGDATKEKNASFGKTGVVVEVSNPDDELKVGDSIIIGPNSGRSAIRDDNGDTMYILNRDEVWAYKSK